MVRLEILSSLEKNTKSVQFVLYDVISFRQLKFKLDMGRAILFQKCLEYIYANRTKYTKQDPNTNM